MKDKCVTSKKYPWKEVDFSKDSLEKRAKWRVNKSRASGEGTDGSPKRRKAGFHYKKKKVVRFKLRLDREKMSK